jgi:hypothetical protein
MAITVQNLQNSTKNRRHSAPETHLNFHAECVTRKRKIAGNQVAEGVASDTFDIASDTFDIASDTFDNASGTLRI